MFEGVSEELRSEFEVDELGSILWEDVPITDMIEAVLVVNDSSGPLIENETVSEVAAIGFGISEPRSVFVSAEFDAELVNDTDLVTDNPDDSLVTGGPTEDSKIPLLGEVSTGMLAAEDKEGVEVADVPDTAEPSEETLGDPNGKLVDDARLAVLVPEGASFIDKPDDKPTLELSGVIVITVDCGGVLVLEDPSGMAPVYEPKDALFCGPGTEDATGMLLPGVAEDTGTPAATEVLSSLSVADSEGVPVPEAKLDIILIV